jgi:hypothetical protein
MNIIDRYHNDFNDNDEDDSDMKKERKLVILPESKLACSQIQKINSILKEKAPN